MLPKFLTHLNTKMATRDNQRLCCTLPVVLMTILLMVLQQSIVSSAEKDFNFNDSQVPLIEPKDEQTILIDTHHQSSTIHDEQQTHHIHHHNKHHLQQPTTHHHQQQQKQQHLHHELEEQDPYAVELSHCRYGDNEIVLSLVLKSYNWHDFNESRKAKVLEKLSKFFAIPKEFITMESVTKHELYEMQKVALKKGNNKCHNNNRKLGRVNFIIGCGSTYFTVSEPLTKQIGEQFKNGALDNITGEKFGWWIIWNKQYKTRAQRNRRQIEGSGDDDEDEEYDYDEDYIDGPDVSTTTTTTTSTTASSHAHRHHHGDETDDDTTLEPENTQDLLNKVSSTTPQSMDESSAIVTSTATVITTTPAPTQTSVPISEVQTSTTTTTTALPDYVEPRIENTPPMIKNRINKFAVTAGKTFRYSVPMDTFYDSEDLSNLRLDLTNENGHELKSNSWLQFNAETREIYGLPLEDAVSKWSYRLTATDSGNESVTEIVEISVQQHRYVRSVNHEINIAVKINEKSMHFIDWPLKLIEAIAKTLGDADTSAVVVREIRSSPQDPNTATLVYFNETFPNNVCPERVELTNLVKRLDVSRLNDLVQPTLGIKQLTGQLIGNCKETNDIKPKTPTINIKNVNPVPRNQIDRINATMGHLLVYKVPSDTFFDSNDNELTLSLKTKDHKELSSRHWLQFDAKNEEFYGIPKSGDIGDEEYQLVAEDAGGLTANDALVVVVYPAPKKDFSVYIKFYLAIRHELFNADLQRKFVERIAALFGDSTTQNIQIRSINPHHDFDGTIVNIYNTTLFKSHNRCPEEEMEMLRNVYLHDDTVRERVKKTMGPELNVTKVQVITAASCNVQIDVTHREFIPTKTEEPLLKSTFSEDYLYTIILPAIIIISMILIALIVACCLHRRRRKSGKMELGDEEERKSFRTKGIPVIFQDELDEKPEIGNKSPIILKDEKPPLLPPSYNTSNMNGDNDVDEYVPPPAVVVGGREARGKSPATPSYRKPPPYVSP